ncbi:spermidine synthase [Aeromicrobium erythreum]|uniref:Spermidine synthase n=1 Tax=Aeromicrobium erythreum TaxID=2041 RepID=A0A0U4BIZ5_9ACTN|nr:spermidine synthase [Aeromicrobium erythreum]ALX05185.1 spermidine synthase [Aeromicrobium erythreum]
MARFEELDWAETPWGLVVLRRRFDLVTQRDVHEVKLGDDYLMSSQFTVSERALAELGLRAAAGSSLRVMVGGLGLGYTAFEALRDDRVVELVVVDALDAVIRWHRDELFDDTRGLASDPRTTLVRDDFFDLVRTGRLERPVDVLLVDIDHAPDWLLRTDHGDFYTVEGQRAAARMLVDDGVFGLWSDEPPDDAFVDVMRQAFATAEAHVATFDNPLTGGTSTATIYVGTRA